MEYNKLIIKSSCKSKSSSPREENSLDKLLLNKRNRKPHFHNKNFFYYVYAVLPHSPL